MSSTSNQESGGGMTDTASSFSKHSTPSPTLIEPSHSATLEVIAYDANGNANSFANSKDQINKGAEDTNYVDEAIYEEEEEDKNLAAKEKEAASEPNTKSIDKAVINGAQVHPMH